MAEQERFTFDDDDKNELEETQLDSSLPENSDVKIEDSKVPEDLNNIVVDSNDDDNTMKNKDKWYKKIKKWHIVLIVFFLIIASAITYVFVSTGNNGPVFGDRCASLLAIDQNKFKEVEAVVRADNPAVTDFKITVECRIVNITIKFIDNTAAVDAQNLAVRTLHMLDDALAGPRDEGAPYSQVFGNANGRGQYNVEFFLTSNGDTAFPIFGTKHPSNVEVSFTNANVKHQETTDKVNAEKAKDDAANAAQ